jgi:hypothetical protein
MQTEKSLAAYKAGLAVHTHAQQAGITRRDKRRSAATLSIWTMISEWSELYAQITVPHPELDEDARWAIAQYGAWAAGLVNLSNRLLHEVRQRALVLDDGAYRTAVDYATAIARVSKEFYDGAYVTLDPEAISHHGASLHIYRVQHASAVLRTSHRQTNGRRTALVREFRTLLQS